MSPFANWCAFFVFNSAWQLLALSAASAVLVRSNARMSNGLQHRIWVYCLLLAVLVPGISTYLGLVPIHSASYAKSVPDELRWKVARPPEHGRLTLHLTEVSMPHSSGPVAELVAVLYAGSLLFGVYRLLFRLEKTRRIVARGVPYDPPPGIWDGLRGIQGLKAYLLMSPDVHGPATVSWPRPMILLPSTFNRMTDEERTAVVAHEAAHIKRHDFLANIALEAISILLCYHPLVSWLKHRIAECREAACDELAAEGTLGRAAYARSLLSVVQRAQGSSEADLMLGISETNLERRIMNLVKACVTMSGRQRKLLHAACLLALIASGSAVLSLSLHPASVQAAGMPAFPFDPTQTFDTLKPSAQRKPAPDFTLVDNHGKTIQLSAYKGQVVLLDFWATWCGGCKLEIPWYMQFDRMYRKEGLAVIGVSMDEKGWAAVRPFLDKKRDDETGGMIAMQYPVVIGNDALAGRFGLTSMPMTLLIDREGKIAVSHTGVVDKDNFESNLRQLLKE